NQAEILADIEQTIGVHIEIVSEEKEAEYSFVATQRALPYRTGICADLGGGSCEFTAFEAGEPSVWASLPIGSLGLERIEKEVNDEQYATWTTKQLSASVMQHAKAKTFIAIGGNARAIAKVHSAIKNTNYRTIHGYTLSVQELFELAKEIELLGVKRLTKFDGITTSRAETLVACVKFFAYVCSYFKTETFVVCKDGVREGYLVQKTQPKLEGITDHDTETWQRLATIKRKRDGVVPKLISFLQAFDEIVPEGRDFELQRLAIESYRSVDIGNLFYEEHKYQHTFYYMMYRLSPNTTFDERLRLALLSAYKSNRKLTAQLSEVNVRYTPEQIRAIERYGIIVRWFIAMQFDLFPTVPELRVTRVGETLDVCIVTDRVLFFEQELLEKFSKALVRVLTLEVKVSIFVK
ncbi:MAG: hypothetical protein ACRC5C_13110, partial [Bacilli bacterium]